MDRGKIILGTWGIGTEFDSRMKIGEKSAAIAYLDGMLMSAVKMHVKTIDTSKNHSNGLLNTYLFNQELIVSGSFQTIIKVGYKRHIDCYSVDKDLRAISTEIKQYENLTDSIAYVILYNIIITKANARKILSLIKQLKSVFVNYNFGIVSHTPEDFLLFAADEKIILVLEFNGINFRFQKMLIDRLYKNGYSIWAMMPLANGFLGYRNKNTDFGILDWRYQLSIENVNLFTILSRQFLSNFTSFSGLYSNAAISIAFIVCNPQISGLLYGPKSIEQLMVLDLVEQLSDDNTFCNLCKALYL